MAKYKAGDKAKWYHFNVVILTTFEDCGWMWYEITATDFDAPTSVWVEEEQLKDI